MARAFDRYQPSPEAAARLLPAGAVGLAPAMRGHVFAGDPFGRRFVPEDDRERAHPDLISVREPGPADPHLVDVDPFPGRQIDDPEPQGRADQAGMIVRDVVIGKNELTSIGASHQGKQALRRQGGRSSIHAKGQFEGRPREMERADPPLVGGENGSAIPEWRCYRAGDPSDESDRGRSEWTPRNRANPVIECPLVLSNESSYDSRDRCNRPGPRWLGDRRVVG